MNLKQEFSEALRARAHDDTLLAVVKRFKDEGGTQRQAYDILESIWLEHGFDDGADKEGDLRDSLEYVIEKVWYGAPLWNEELSSEKAESR